jgi:hypothetical protein
MSEEFELIDLFVSDIKRNTNFLKKILFPRIGLIVLGIGFLLISIILLIK